MPFHPLNSITTCALIHVASVCLNIKKNQILAGKFLEKEGSSV